jgi:hypothetical protein
MSLHHLKDKRAQQRQSEHDEQARQLLAKNESFDLLLDDDEGASSHPKKVKNVKRKGDKIHTKNSSLRKKSDAKDEIVHEVTRIFKRSKGNEDELDEKSIELERQRLQDLKERDEFASRLKEKDLERQQKVRLNCLNASPSVPASVLKYIIQFLRTMDMIELKRLSYPEDAVTYLRS